MNAAVFWRSVGIAFVLSAIGAAAFALLAPLAGAALSVRCVLLMVASACVVDLLVRSGRGSGRLLSATAWAITALALLLLNPALWLWLAVSALFLWLLRSITLHGRPLLALIDAGLVLAALALAIASLRHSGSLGLALWSFLLLQALIDALTTATPKAATPTDRFAAAQHSAEAALRALLTPRFDR